MKKAVNWAMHTGSIGFMLNGIIGIVKLLHGNNKVAMQAHLAVVFFVIAAVGIICKILVDLCFIAGEWLQSDCERLTAGCIGAACWFIVLICVFCKIRMNRCPHCGKVVETRGDYCPYCGEKVKL